uniref:Putative ovule protein n=1 Tax=Solanum chacoense TaxID=4108 RepID=A0A0V0HBX6_SOLCH
MYPRGDRDVSERGEYVGHYDAEPTMLRHWQLHIELKNVICYFINQQRRRRPCSRNYTQCRSSTAIEKHHLTGFVV